MGCPPFQAEKNMQDAQLAKLRNKAVTRFAVLMQNPMTKPAAFGVACRVIQEDSGCDLLAAILLLSYWLEQDGIEH